MGNTFQRKRMVQVTEDRADTAGLAGDSRVLGWLAARPPSCCCYFSFSLLRRGRKRSLQEDIMWPGLFPPVICLVLPAGPPAETNFCLLYVRPFLRPLFFFNTKACGEALK